VHINHIADQSLKYQNIRTFGFYGMIPLLLVLMVTAELSIFLNCII
jgi:hypothetical protein